MIRLKYIIGFGDYTDATCKLLPITISFEILTAEGDNVDVFHWSCIEIATAVICSCLPALRALMSSWLPNIFGNKQPTTEPSLRSGQAPAFDRRGSQRLHDIESIENKSPGGHSGNYTSESTGEMEQRWSQSSEETELVIMTTEEDVTVIRKS
jgi:hypothetical protein